MTSAGRLHRIIRSALVHEVVLGVALAASGAAPWVAPAEAVTTHARETCASVEHGFRPTSLSVDRLLTPTKVLALGQDRYGVPKPPPLTDQGKWQLAWDKRVGVRPGDSAGVVRLTAHTYPAGTAKGGKAPALGNLLLERLRTGARIVVSGPANERLCYRVTRRQQVRATHALAGYYDTVGQPQLAILVCSGKRRGPGDWTHRTIWYAEPLSPGATAPLIRADER